MLTCCIMLLKSLWSLHSRRYSNLDWTQPWAAADPALSCTKQSAEVPPDIISSMIYENNTSVLWQLSTYIFSYDPSQYKKQFGQNGDQLQHSTSPPSWFLSCLFWAFVVWKLDVFLQIWAFSSLLWTCVLCSCRGFLWVGIFWLFVSGFVGGFFVCFVFKSWILP